jgi:hypothetical protein
VNGLVPVERYRGFLRPRRLLLRLLGEAVVEAEPAGGGGIEEEARVVRRYLLVVVPAEVGGIKACLLLRRSSGEIS